MKHKQPTNIWIVCGIVIIWTIIIISSLFIGQVSTIYNHDTHINVLVWGQVLDKEFLSDFERETGIQVNMSYFENNEELLAKLHGPGEHDYDLVMPSDWAAELLIQDGLIKKLDRSKINVWKTIYPALLHHYFDINNNYTIPFYWSLFGIGINKKYWHEKMPDPTWGLVFNEQIMPERIGMVEDPRALILIAASYLFGHIEQLDTSKINQIKQLLIKQKPYVEIYTDSRVEYILASGVVPIVVGLLGDLLKVMRRFDTINFILPKEGG
ncbi:MAG TPA: extracellular solute-binding protein, partial [Candidatus Babeliales bacterium]|nr:extracellular solute-binding protein [Candidatus Babeliales bacterium]